MTGRSTRGRRGSLASLDVTRRLVLAAGALGAAVLFSSCSTVDKPFATVNGVELDGDAFEALAEDQTIAEFTQATATGVPDGVLFGPAARSVASLMVQSELVRQANEERGVTISEAARAEQEDVLAQNLPSWGNASEPTRTFLLGFLAGVQSLFESLATPPEELRSRYEAGVAESGLLCISHLVVETEEEALAALERIEGGEAFAAVAAEVSIEPGAADSGGALTDQNTGLPCSDLASVQAGYVPTFAAAAIEAEIGVPTAPVQTEFGYHVILLRPFDEVADSVAALVDNATEQQVVTEIFEQAEVSIASSVGTWSQDRRVVVALDEAEPAE